MSNNKEFVLVSIQIACLGLLVITRPVIPTNFYLCILYISGITLGLWAVIIMMKASKLRITPGVAPGSKLITNGVYKYVRHPMYSGVLLVCLSLVMNYPSLLRVIILIILAADLAVKINYEEKLLENNFPEYKSYKLGTKRLIPYFY